jgi:predicted DNA-binding transcriptional regulator AlpA
MNALTLPETGFLRIQQVLSFYPVSRSTWWEMVRDGRAPKAVKLSEGCTAWRCEDIRRLIESTTSKQAA